MSGVKLNFASRRELLCKEVLENSIIILASSGIKSRNSDSEYPFRQDSNFYYLSGFNEPDSLLVLKPGTSKPQFFIFCRDKDSVKEQWEGPRAGPAGAKLNYGADKSFSISMVNEILPSLLEGVRNIYFSMS